MHVRLVFAIAAHLEPEILILDEVLAVGDAEFQKKCLAKIREAATGGRTNFVLSATICKLFQSFVTEGCFFVQGSLSMPAAPKKR